ncbi:MAG: hypothetical protein ACHQ0J_00005, partial [Candidatus Dormibacterales bacterium]
PPPPPPPPLPAFGVPTAESAPFGAPPEAPPPPPPSDSVWTPSSGPPDQVWTPGPPQYAPAEQLEVIESEPQSPSPGPSYDMPSEPAPAALAGAGWSIVAPDTKPDSIVSAPEPRKKEKRREPNLTESWLLATGDPNTAESEEPAETQNVTRAVAQYLILVVGLIAVLVGVLVMVANSHGA